MEFPLVIQSYAFGGQTQQILAPDPQYIEQAYRNRKDAAYWARVWPAAIGLCQFLQEHPWYIAGKTVLELAACLGLPGLYAARTARDVTITDKEPLAAPVAAQSARYLKQFNVTAATLDWADLADAAPQQEVVLLSDVNYEPALFDQLLTVVKTVLADQRLVVLSTPQRLVAKAFISQLLPYGRQQAYAVPTASGVTDISVLVLARS